MTSCEVGVGRVWNIRTVVVLALTTSAICCWGQDRPDLNSCQHFLLLTGGYIIPVLVVRLSEPVWGHPLSRAQDAKEAHFEKDKLAVGAGDIAGYRRLCCPLSDRAHGRTAAREGLGRSSERVSYVSPCSARSNVFCLSPPF